MSDDANARWAGKVARMVYKRLDESPEAQAEFLNVLTGWLVMTDLMDNNDAMAQITDGD